MSSSVSRYLPGRGDIAVPSGKETCSGKWPTDLCSGKLESDFIVRVRILGRQTVARPGYNPVPCLLFRSHPRDVFLVCALSNIELRMTLMCKIKNCFLPQ
jgi:hypothetical protein